MIFNIILLCFQFQMDNVKLKEDCDTLPFKIKDSDRLELFSCKYLNVDQHRDTTNGYYCLIEESRYSPYLSSTTTYYFDTSDTLVFVDAFIQEVTDTTKKSLMFEHHLICYQSKPVYHMCYTVTFNAEALPNNHDSLFTIIDNGRLKIKGEIDEKLSQRICFNANSYKLARATNNKEYCYNLKSAFFYE